MNFNLLFILSDKHNKNVLAIKVDKDYRFPFFDKLVGDDVEFSDSPQLYNDFFKKNTGISVFRRYSFNTQHYVAFVFEQSGKMDITPTSGYEWVTYDDFIDAQQDDELREIACGVSRNYTKSINMPWVNADGYTPYFNWLYKVCNKKDIHINGEIKQIKSAFVSTVFCVPTDSGNLYMKIPGKVHITELAFLRELINLNIASLPVWVDYDLDMNVFLMEDMGGEELSWQSDIDTFKKVILQYSKVQKQSFPHLPLKCKYNDYRIATIINKLSGLLEKAFQILMGAKYSITKDECEKLAQNIKSAAVMLKSISGIKIPDTIRHGDFRPGNVRAAGEKYIIGS